MRWQDNICRLLQQNLFLGCPCTRSAKTSTRLIYWVVHISFIILVIQQNPKFSSSFFIYFLFISWWQIRSLPYVIISKLLSHHHMYTSLQYTFLQTCYAQAFSIHVNHLIVNTWHVLVLSTPNWWCFCNDCCLLFVVLWEAAKQQHASYWLDVHASLRCRHSVSIKRALEIEHKHCVRILLLSR